MLAQGDRIGAVVVSDRELDVIPPHRSQERVTRILERVVRRFAVEERGQDTGRLRILSHQRRRFGVSMLLGPFYRHGQLVNQGRPIRAQGIQSATANQSFQNATIGLLEIDA